MQSHCMKARFPVFGMGRKNGEIVGRRTLSGGRSRCDLLHLAPNKLKHKISLQGLSMARNSSNIVLGDIPSPVWKTS